MCTHAQTPYCPSVRTYVSLCTCKSVHMHTNPRLYVVCMYVYMYVCNHVCVCVWVCARVRACEGAYVYVLSYTNVQVHT